MYQVKGLYPMKAQFVFDLLKTNKNRFTPVQLETATGTARRARRALFLARKSGLALEAVRDGGKAIVAYVFSGGALPAFSAPVAKAKAAKASPKKAAAAKTKVVAKTKTVKAPVKKVVVDHSASNKLVDAMIAEEAIKAKNLETMKAVSKREKTMLDKIKEDTRAEFSTMEAEWEAEEADRRDARTAVRENLPKEAYVE
jgi:hypothetical protein